MTRINRKVKGRISIAQIQILGISIPELAQMIVAGEIPPPDRARWAFLLSGGRTHRTVPRARESAGDPPTRPGSSTQPIASSMKQIDEDLSIGQTNRHGVNPLTQTIFHFARSKV
jgi:hypothetical protein